MDWKNRGRNRVGVSGFCSDEWMDRKATSCLAGFYIVAIDATARAAKFSCFSSVVGRDIRWSGLAEVV